jgi:hypothetical protein
VWSYGNVKMVVESKTSSTWLQIKQAHDYVEEHHASSGLVVAPEFTEDNLMAARSYGDDKLLTTNWLVKLLKLKEEGKPTTDALVKILVPIESVKLDYFIDIIYTIAKPEKPVEEEKPVEKPEELSWTTIEKNDATINAGKIKIGCLEWYEEPYSSYYCSRY